MSEVPTDQSMGKWVYCIHHLNPHTTGWCTVGCEHKIALKAQTPSEAVKECRKLGLKLYSDVI